MSHDQTQSATRKFGVNPDTYRLIESLYADQLAAFDRYFSAYPYLFGGRPCLGAFGLMISLHAHLGRDPKQLSQMHANGMNVLRWNERMNQPGADFVESDGWDEMYLDDDEVPEALIDLLRVMAEDFVPETVAAADTINAWLEAKGTIEPGTPFECGVGFAEFEVRRQTIGALAQPYRFWRLKIAQSDYVVMGAEDQKSVDTIVTACNMMPLLEARLTREIGRMGNLEVWQ